MTEYYIPVSELRQRFSVRFRYTEFGFFFFLRSVWRMDVSGRWWQKVLFGLIGQLILLSVPALLLDLIMLLAFAIGCLLAEIYTHFIRPLLQQILLRAVDTVWKVAGWIAIILAILTIFWKYPQIKAIILGLFN